MIPVVAVALIDSAGRVLLQRRRLGARHGGLWEFPGGKVEPGETPESALIREIAEELGIGLAADDLAPAAFSSDPRADPQVRDPHVILLYSCRRWRGEPCCLDGEAVAWFTPADAAALEVPPLDRPFIAQLAPIVAAAPGRGRG